MHNQIEVDVPFQWQDEKHTWYGGVGDAIPADPASGPFHIQAELWYQPIAFRWARNLQPYTAEEPQRFVGHYNSLASGTGVVLAKTETTR